MRLLLCTSSASVTSSSGMVCISPSDARARGEEGFDIVRRSVLLMQLLKARADHRYVRYEHAPCGSGRFVCSALFVAETARTKWILRRSSCITDRPCAFLRSEIAQELGLRQTLTP